MSESIVLACAGGALASIVLFNIPSLLPWLTDNPIPPQILEALRVDVPMLAISFGLCLLTCLVFVWLPAMRFSRPVILLRSRTMRAAVVGCGWDACIR